ncbi:uncharacterized protein P884DRAFT_264659 [Thermothelomyces heterothallicus CBS 202.75]|uniref:uncharacterized protein n=1 Tax=Thermothelomyces heterothallicus CBS 202.75 TaxID=1149848 RepID=UPI0037424E23
MEMLEREREREQLREREPLREAGRRGPVRWERASAVRGGGMDRRYYYPGEGPAYYSDSEGGSGW